jgi:hypothetical protein
VVDAMKDIQRVEIQKIMKNRWRRIAWPLVAIGDAGLLLWGAMAALAPDYLLGPGNAPILKAEYESFTGGSWSALSPSQTGFITLLFRMYGVYIVAFGLLTIFVAATAFRRGESWAWWALLIGNTIAYPSAMLYDFTVNAIGPFEATEYIALAAIYVGLAVTTPSISRQARISRPSSRP